jgi:uncharacterized phiE125 gp8 family phage protein
MSLRPVEKLYPFKGHKQTAAPSAEPVTAAELRTWLEETTTGLPDATANSLITASREAIEEYAGLAMITQTWILVYDRWPSTRSLWWDGVRQGAISEVDGASADTALILPRYPLQSVDGVNVYATDGTATAVSVSTTFDVDVYQKPGRMALKYGKTWPIAGRPINGVEITYISGYGNTASDVPEALKIAIKMMAGHLYAHRGDGCSTEDALNQSGALSMVNKFKAARL